jgi:hypothetical protein
MRARLEGCRGQRQGMEPLDSAAGLQPENRTTGRITNCSAVQPEDGRRAQLGHCPAGMPVTQSACAPLTQTPWTRKRQTDGTCVPLRTVTAGNRRPWAISCGIAAPTGSLPTLHANHHDGGQAGRQHDTQWA